MCITLTYFRNKINNKKSYSEKSVSSLSYSAGFLFLLSTHPNKNHSGIFLCIFCEFHMNLQYTCILLAYVYAHTQTYTYVKCFLHCAPNFTPYLFFT